MLSRSTVALRTMAFRGPLAARVAATNKSARNFHACTSALKAAAASGEFLQTLFINKGGEDLMGNDIANAMEALANADAVCFDVDSTVINEEGIDVLADSLGKGKEVAELTAAAMGGTTKFEEALAMRLDLMKPSKQDIADCLVKHPLVLTPGVEGLIEALIEAQVAVYLVSGGFRIMIEPVAMSLCVAKDQIFANTILFNEDGSYAGFDPDEPTSADMGKPKALGQIKEKGGYETMIMVGDGATDAQAKPPANAFIGFGGVALRPAVQEKACWYVKDFDAMTEIITKHHKNQA